MLVSPPPPLAAAPRPDVSPTVPPTVPHPPSPTSGPLLAANLRDVQDRIAAAARRAGRAPDSVRLVAVTKNVAAEVAAELVRLGVLDLGENRADRLAAKVAALAAIEPRPRWHFVGHLQRNKAAEVARDAALVHSVDSERLLDALDRLAGEAGRTLDVLAQVKLTEEATKSGLDPRELPRFLERGRAARHVRVVGLMAMAPLDEDAERARAGARVVFQRAAELAREHAALFGIEHDAEVARGPELSIGMSDDFEVAIEAGATLVRVGTRLFAGLAGGGPA